MAPAGNNKHCQDSMNQTFYYTNVVPQDLDNNGNYWNRLEIWCRNLVKQYQDVWITSGPLWLPVEEPSKEEENTNDQSDKVVDGRDLDVAQTETKKKRKVRPPHPAARRMSYPVIGPIKSFRIIDSDAEGCALGGSSYFQIKYSTNMRGKVGLLEI